MRLFSSKPNSRLGLVAIWVCMVLEKLWESNPKFGFLLLGVIFVWFVSNPAENEGLLLIKLCALILVLVSVSALSLGKFGS